MTAALLAVPLTIAALVLGRQWMHAVWDLNRGRRPRWHPLSEDLRRPGEPW